MNTNPAGFDPVLLDLSDSNDYALLTNALRDYANELHGNAVDERERIRYNNLPESESEEKHWLEQAARARRILGEIERQMDLNGATRQQIARAQQRTVVKNEGAVIGRFAAELEEGMRFGQPVNDRLHHLGDDTGAALTRAFRAGGAAAAADVIDAYLEAFNEFRKSHGHEPLSPTNAIKNLAWAITPKGITELEQAAVRDEFLRRH